MEGDILYREKLPIKPLEMEFTDNDIKFEVIGFSGDSVRTCIYYNIEDNPLDYQVSEAYLIDQNERAYCLVSVERKGKDRFNSWMEFGPIPPETMQMELHVIRLRQAPSCNDFKFKGRTFVDPWDPEFPLSNEIIDKMDRWLGGVNGEDALMTSDWDLGGSWVFEIPTGEWQEEEVDIIKPLDYSLTLGGEKFKLLEFRNSNTGAFLVFEARDESLQKLGDAYKLQLIKALESAQETGDFEKELAKLGVNVGYQPAGLVLKLRDVETDDYYTPAYVDSRGVIQNRIYYFFDDCICAKKLEAIVLEIINAKLDPPVEFDIDMPHFLSDEVLEIDRNLGDLRVRGRITFQELVFSDENIKISYLSKPGENLEDLSLVDVSLVIKNKDGSIEEFPTLGEVTHFEISRERFKKIITFPGIHRIKEAAPDHFILTVKSVNIKPSGGVRFSFEACCEPGICMRKKNQ